MDGEQASSVYQQRIARLQTTMRQHKAGLAVLSFTDQMRYLTGYVEGAHERLLALFVPASGEPTFLVPFMNAQAARGNPAQIGQVQGWTDSDGWQRYAQQIVSNCNLASDAVVLIDDELHSAHLLALQQLFPQLHYQAAGNILAQLRGIKAADELHALQMAAEMIDRIFEETLLQLREGVTETQIREYVLTAIAEADSTPSFGPLVCFGANGAMPHHRSNNTPLKQGDMVVLDIGCTFNGYCSDITRTVAFGEPTDPDARQVYKIVSDAHYNARAAVLSGATCGDVDKAARDCIEAAGYGAAFFHRTGHGIGMSEHEPPGISAGNTQPLRVGMCFSVEPGIYLEGRFGVRIENIVTVTDAGARSLNAEPARELRIVGE